MNPSPLDSLPLATTTNSSPGEPQTRQANPALAHPAAVGELVDPPKFSPLTQIPLALFAAMLLDFTDLFSGFLPVGVLIGLFIGAPLAWFAARSFGLSQRVRLGAAVAGFVYCIIPGTEPIPAATGLALIESVVKLVRPAK